MAVSSWTIPLRAICSVESPMSTRYLPGSARQRLPATPKYAKERASRGSTTSRDSPGRSMILVNPFNSFFGRGTDDLGAETYNCGTTAPARDPALLTLNTASYILFAVLALRTCRSRYSNDV